MWFVRGKQIGTEVLKFLTSVKLWENGAPTHWSENFSGSLPAVLFDVNNDATVNILDLVVVANAFGRDAPDLNADGIVNILDLIFVAQAVN